MPFYRPGAQTETQVRLLEFPPDMHLPLVVSILDRDMEEEGRTTAALMETFGYRDLVEKLDIKVPGCFRTDFASIPAAARAIISPFGRHAKAAVLHDWLYAIGEPGRKPVADLVFRRAMQELGVETWQIDLMYWAVHLFGGAAYKRAATDWPTTFANGETGAGEAPIFPRETAFVGQPHGPQPI